VRVVQVHRIRLAESAQVAAFAHVARQHVLQRGADQKELLLQAQFAPGGVLSSGYSTQFSASAVLLVRRGGMVAAAEGCEVDRPRARACHWRNVDTRSVLWPGTMKSQACAITISAGIQRGSPSAGCTRPPKPTE
jgi:hypothetical protein